MTIRSWLSACLLASFAASSLLAKNEPPQWKAGVAKIKITPEQSMWMSGYASRKEPAQGTLHDLWAKALVLQDTNDRQVVLVTLDLVGIPRALSQRICSDLNKRHKFARSEIMLAVSHTHTGPVVGSNLISMYFLDEKHQKLIEQYSKTLHQKILQVVDQAVKDLAPANLSRATGIATFAVNRRENSEREVPMLRKEGKLKGPFDHDVPVLAVHDADKKKLRAVVFGYACHATVLSFLKWSGDYPGFAQIELEKAHPGTIALFWAGCGGDQNPLPRRTVALAQKYGAQLADAVDAVLKKQMTPVAPTVQASYKEIPLPFADLPSRDQLVNDTMSTNRYVASRAKLLLERIKNEGSLKGEYPYPIQVWRLGGNLDWTSLGGEVVVDFALRLKGENKQRDTWVTAYANDVMAYIPSLRVLKEGKYEGGGAMVYYGQPTVWSPGVEELIVSEVHRQFEDLSK